MQPNVERLRADASKCRDLAFTAMTVDARDILTEIAEKYDQAAIVLDRQPRKAQHDPPAFVWLRT